MTFTLAELYSLHVSEPGGPILKKVKINEESFTDEDEDDDDDALYLLFKIKKQEQQPCNSGF